MPKLTLSEDSVTFSVRVIPRASKSALAGDMDGAVKIRIAAPPVDGEANDELIRFLAKLLGVGRQQVEIISGATSKNKIVRITGVTIEDCQKMLQQDSLNFKL